MSTPNDNRSIVPNTRWWPDEDQYGRDLLTSNTHYTWQQLADAITARFRSTRYTDPGTGKQKERARGGRSALACQSHYKAFVKELRGQGSGSQRSSEQTGGRGGVSGQQTDAAQPERGGTESMAGLSQGREGAGSFSAGRKRRQSNGGDDDEAVVIYASGKMQRARRAWMSGAISSDKFQELLAEDDEDDELKTLSPSDIGEDETPLDDLEEMVRWEVEGEA